MSAVAIPRSAVSALSLVPAAVVEDEPLYEILDGLKVELPPMSSFATLITRRIGIALDGFVASRRLGTCMPECLFLLDPKRNRRRRPDVAFVSAERWPLDRLVPETGDLEVVPDLAVEVISPTDLYEDVLAKLLEYFNYGVRQVWLVMPRQRTVHRYDGPRSITVFGDADDLNAGPLLPGFQMPLVPLFSRLPLGDVDGASGQ